MKQTKQPHLTDETTLAALGMADDGFTLKSLIKRNLRIIDEQQFLTRYTWYNLPYGFDANMLERILYYRGELMVFYVQETDRFYALPFTYCGELDCYGRMTKVRPLPFTGGANLNEDDLKRKADGMWLSLIEREPLYDLPTEPLTAEEWLTKCVIISDYSKQISQHILPRQALNEVIIDMEADYLPYMKTAMMNATGVAGLRVQGADEAVSVELAAKAVEQAALNQKKWIPIASGIELQDLSTTNVANAEEFLLAMQAIDNFRQMGMGIGSGDIFQKKAHMLQSEADAVLGQTSSVLNDGLERRQSACLLLNYLFPLGTWCEISESNSMYDRNMDGDVTDNSASAQVDNQGEQTNEQ
ncbi:MAG: hypothetical protein MJ053_07140 [Elusimicrobiaceae bacterium]|nr:hypothetical protein [Elusimicrobiaceae bacterium]